MFLPRASEDYVAGVLCWLAIVASGGLPNVFATPRRGKTKGQVSDEAPDPVSPNRHGADPFKSGMNRSCWSTLWGPRSKSRARHT